MKLRVAEHPITHAETLYMRRSVNPPQRWRTWINRLVTTFVVAYIVISMLAYLSSGVVLISLRLLISLEDWNILFIPLAIIWTLAFHFRLMFQTLILSANSISRERGGGTWDVLVLTPVDSDQIIVGKWRAVIQRQWRQYALLGLLRGLVVVWVTTVSYYPMYYGLNPAYAQEYAIPQIMAMLVTIVFVLVITLLNLGFTAACGLSVSVDHHSSAIALVRAFGTRVLVLVAAALHSFGHDFPAAVVLYARDSQHRCRVYTGDTGR